MKVIFIFGVMALGFSLSSLAQENICYHSIRGKTCGVIKQAESTESEKRFVISNITNYRDLWVDQGPLRFGSAKVLCKKLVGKNAYPDESNGPAKIIKKHSHFKTKYIHQVKCAMASTDKKELALRSYESFKSTNAELVVRTESAFEELKNELKTNKELRGLIKKSGRDKDALRALKEFLQLYFIDRDIYMGLVVGDEYKSYDLLVGGASLGFYTSQIGIGPSVGYSKGVSVVSCLLGNNGRTDSYNIGVNAKAIVAAGITAGLYVGMNGICIQVGAGTGLDLGAQASILTIE